MMEFFEENIVTMAKRDQWGSSFGFLMSTAGAAIGLGSIWRFPYMCGQNGGGAFIIVNIICVALIGLPVLISELAIGRKSRIGGASAFTALVKDHKPIWYGVGLIGLTTGLVITSYYSVISGWSLEYLYMSLTGAISELNGSNTQEYFSALTDSNQRQIIWHLIFTGATVFILLGGISGGIEKFNKISMPTLFVLLLGLAAYSLNLEAQHAAETGGQIESLRFMFIPDWSKFTMESVFRALGQAAFVLSIAIGTMVAYGSYLDSKENITKLGGIVAGMVMMVGIISAMIVFPIVFANGLEVNAGTGLVFITLPALFSQMPPFIAPLFYILIFFAAMTSSVSLLEPAISYLVDEFKFSRHFACFTAGLTSASLGIVWIGSSSLEKTGLFENVDNFISNIIIPIEAIAITMYAGWFLSHWISRKEMKHMPRWFYQLYVILCRYVAPGAVGAILLKQLFF